ncbi:MAG: hypothetical protein AMJ90_01830 [candidate division Zixibacteria bacterium SM23_73_2]|nr:MAG: hypothetical protein AMJ90_01830 [candidate division Zixibacteria bacterium SM23_73_2]
MERMYNEEMLKELKGFEVELYARYEKYFDANYFLHRNMLEMLKEDEAKIRADDDIKRVISYLFSACFKTYTSILLLCGKGFAPAAGILTRSLFENVINIKWILNNDQKERARKFLNYSIVIKKKLYEKYNQYRIFDRLKSNVLDRMESVESVKKAYTEVKDDYPNEIKWSGKNTRELAEEEGVNMGYDYDFYYWFFSLLTHSTVAAKETSTTVEGSTESVFYGPSFSPEIMVDILVLSYKYVLMAFVELDLILNLGKENNIKRFYKGFEEISVRRNKDV